VLALQAITMTTGATINGSTLARNAAVTLDSNTISRAVCAAPVGTSGTTSTTAVSGGGTTTTSGTGSTATTVPGGGTTGTAGGPGGGTNPGRPDSGTGTGLTTGTVGRPPLATTGLGRDGALLGAALTALGLLLMLVTRRRWHPQLLR
jgi:hypothetical protein